MNVFFAPLQLSPLHREHLVNFSPLYQKLKISSTFHFFNFVKYEVDNHYQLCSFFNILIDFTVDKAYNWT